MNQKIFKVGCTWEYIQDQYEIESEHFEESEHFDEVVYVAITDRVTAQVCIIRRGNKYGIYTLDHTNGFGGPGTWCSPTVIPFPYDEVKCCTFMGEEYGLFAFHIGNKWGILKVVDGEEPSQGMYDVEYLLTKRRIIVTCDCCASIEDLELHLGKRINWKNPFV